MNIGQIASKTGISAKMVRYYEHIGLLLPVRRNASGYRVYSDKEEQHLKFIKKARDLGFSISDIAELLSLWHNEQRASVEVKRLAQRHIDELEQKAKKLQLMANTLKELVYHCPGDSSPGCSIIEELADNL